MREPAKDFTLWLLGPQGGAISRGQRLPRIAPPNPPARPGFTLPAGRLRLRLGGTRSIGAYWVRSLDRTEDFCSIGVPGEGTHNCAMGTPAHQPTLENYCSIKQLGNQQVRPMWASIPRTIFFKGELRGAQERRRRGDTGASIEAQ